MAWDIPEPLSTLDVLLEDDSVTIVRRHGNPAGPRLVMSHGTGLAIDLYVPFWSAFLDDFDLFVYDIRNHGWNTRGPLANHTIPVFARDHDRILAAIERHGGPRPTIGVYHSLAALAAHAALAPAKRAAAKRTGRPPSEYYDAVVMFDRRCTCAVSTTTSFRSGRARCREDPTPAKPLPKPRGLPRQGDARRQVGSRCTGRTRPDGEDHASRVRRRPGLRASLPAEYEAQVFDDARRWTRALTFVGLGCPVKVIGSDPALPYAYVPTLDADQLAALEFESIPGTTHYLPLEAPAECAAAVLAYLGRRGLCDSA